MNDVRHCLAYQTVDCIGKTNVRYPTCSPGWDSAGKSCGTGGLSRGLKPDRIRDSFDPGRAEPSGTVGTQGPMRIVSLLPSATEIVCALGLESDLVGVTHECDFPSWISSRPHLTSSLISHKALSSSEIDHSVKSQLDGHGSIYSLDERLLEDLEPDLVITQELCEVCAVSYETVLKAAKLFTAGAKVVSLEPNTIEDIFSNIESVGSITGTGERAKRLTADLRYRLADIRRRTASFSDRPKVMMLEWLEPPFAPGHWVPEQVEIAGGTCVLGVKGKKSVTTTYFEIAESKPDVLVFIPCGYNADDVVRQLGSTEFPEVFADLPAIREGNVWALDASAYFSRPGPRVVVGTEILAKIFHPDVFGPPSENEAIRVNPELLRFSDRSG